MKSKYSGFTIIPNEVFDQHLPHLNQTQLKVLLIILRQTLGWIDKKTGKRKRKDWIARNQFSSKTGISRKSVSFAIQGLIDKELIVVLNYRNKELRTSKERKGQRKLFYAYAPYFRASIHQKRIKELRNKLRYFPK